MKDEQTMLKSYELRFLLKRGACYYNFFHVRWRMIQFTEKIAAFVLFVVSTALNIANYPVVATVSTALGAFGFILDCIVRVQHRVDENARKEGAFVAMLNELPLYDCDTTEEQIESITKRKTELEKGEIYFGCVSAMCHNDVLCSLRRSDEQLKLSWKERWIGRFLPIKYRGA